MTNDPNEEVVTPDGRRKLAKERRSITHKAKIDGTPIFITVGLYKDGRPGEVFIKGAGKHGSTMTALMETFGAMMSMGLQYGVPLQAVIEKFTEEFFEPHGLTDNPDIPEAPSLVAYTVRWLELRFGRPAA
jgi:ribonucleoside-diphosphate reductase alpha chain